jgi:hypothetical protein
MKISSVSMNRPLNKAQGAIRKVSAVSQPLTLAVDEVSDYASLETPVDNDKHSKKKSPGAVDTLGSEVDVWV